MRKVSEEGVGGKGRRKGSEDCVDPGDCVVCANPANHTQRLVASSDRVLVGATGMYEARCRHCFDPHLAAVEKV